MAWNPGSKKPASMEDSADKGKSAMPPPCPRCELTKSQFTRTIQNYQKAYRKKVEGLKTELKSTRLANQKLTKQVKNLRRFTRIHAPSVLIGALAGALAMKFLGKFLHRRKPAGEAEDADDDDDDDEEEEADQEPKEAAS